MAAKNPQWFALFKSDYVMNKEGLKSFKLVTTNYPSFSVRSILPVNPYREGTKERNDFEFFRQSMSTYAKAVGYWPEGRTIFEKSEVCYTLIEITKSIPRIVNENGIGYDFINYKDLTEVAIYVGEGGRNGNS